MLISVIVPVYNSEKYLRRCINSVIEQEYTQWELIIIDDGSDDSSLSIARNYESRDERIKVLHQENSGPGVARNLGIDFAQGDYIVFLDSDDFLESNYLSLLSKKNEDVVFIDVNQVDESMKLIKTEYMSSQANLSKEQLIRVQMTGKIEWGGVRKAVKRKLLIENNIKYSKHKIGEEAVYSFLIVEHAKNYSFIDKPVYSYVNRHGSQSDLKIDDPWGPVVCVLRETLENEHLYEKYANTVNAFLLTSLVVSLDRVASFYNYSEYRQYAKKKITAYEKEFDNSYQIDWDSTSFKVKIVYPFILLRLPTVVYVASKLKKLIKMKSNV